MTVNQKAHWARPADDPRQDEPAEAGSEQRPAADDHHVGVREVAHEMPGVAGSRQVISGPRQVLEDHVQRAEDEEEATRDEVLRRLAVVGAELVLGIRLGAHRGRLARHELEHRREHDREEADVGQELERCEVLDVHGRPLPAGPSEGRARGRRPSASSRGRWPSAPRG